MTGIDPRRAEWERLKAEATREARALRKSTKGINPLTGKPRKKLKECSEQFQAIAECRNELRRLHRDRNRLND